LLEIAANVLQADSRRHVANLNLVESIASDREGQFAIKKFDLEKFISSRVLAGWHGIDLITAN